MHRHVPSVVFMLLWSAPLEALCATDVIKRVHNNEHLVFNSMVQLVNIRYLNWCKGESNSNILGDVGTLVSTSATTETV